MQNTARHIAHIESAISCAPEWKIRELHWYTERYYTTVAQGTWSAGDAWVLCGEPMARMLGYSAQSAMPRAEFVRTVSGVLEAHTDGLTSLTQITGAAPWAVAMVYMLGA